MTSVVHRGTVKPMVLVRLAVSCALGALLCAITSGMPRHQAGRPDNWSANPLVVPQANVAPRTTTLPVVDGKGIHFTRLSTDEGLSQTRVIQIVQDDQGFMWFGSQYGLNRYDGYKFKVFKHESGNPNSLSGVFISSLFKDRSGLLWIGCDEFLDKFDPVSETFTHYRIDTDAAQGETVPVTDISQDHVGMLWLATSVGLYRFDPSNGRTIRYHHDPNNPFSLSSSQVKATAEDKKGRFWVASSEGLDEFDRNTGKVTLHVPLHERGEMSLYEDRFGVFWITHVTGGGLAVFDRSRNTLIPYSFHKGHLSEAIPTGMMAMLEDQDGNLWFGTMGDGLLKFDRKGRKFIRYRNDPMNPESLGEDDLAALFQDREGNIWVGLHMMAPNRFSTRPPLFEKFRHEPGNRNSLSGTMVNGIYEDREGILWVSAIDGLNRVDRRTGQYTLYRTGGPGISSRPTSIIEDRSGFLWLGSDGHGLTRFDPKTGRLKTFRHSTTEQFSLSSDLVTRVLIDHTGTMWATTFDGLDRFDPATSHFTMYKLNQQSAEIDIELKEDLHGALWVGTHSSGLERFDPTTKQFTVYRQKVDDPTSLSNNRVNSVYFDHSGTMWVGTQDGLDKFDPKTGRFKSYYEQDGLSGNVVSCILEDERGKLWMSTNNGLSVFDRSEQTFKHYSAADGLPGADLTGWGACYKSPSGEMFFGGFSGGIAVHPNKVVDSLYVPRIVLTDFRLFDHPVRVAADSPLSKSIGYTNALRLSHDQNVFTLEFSALSYFNPATNRYRYKLEGLDRQWHEVGSDQRLVTYTTLPARTYTFRAQCATSRGAWSEPGVELRLEILPARWNTWWFRAVCMAAVLALLWAIYRIRVGVLEQRQQLLEQNQQQLERHRGEITALNDRLMKVLDDERTRIAGELHDGVLQQITSVSLLLGAVKRQVPPELKAKEKIAELQKKLIDMGTDIRRLSHELHPAVLQESGLPEALSAYCEEFSKVHGIPVSCEADKTVRELSSGAALCIYRIAQEALGNVAKHSSAKQVRVRLTRVDSRVCLSLSDDGVGFAPDRAGDSGGLGLINMRERVRQLHGTLELESEPGRGTTVRAEVPFRPAA